MQTCNPEETTLLRPQFVSPIGKARKAVGVVLEEEGVTASSRFPAYGSNSSYLRVYRVSAAISSRINSAAMSTSGRCVRRKFA